MTITAADLKLFAAEYPLDATYGGGRRSGYAITTGGENNVFPDVPANFRSAGGVQFRKVYPSVVSANAEALMQAGVILASGPADAAQGIVLFPFGDQQTTADAAAVALAGYPYTVNQYATYSDSTDLPATKKRISGYNPALGTPVGLLFSGAVPGTDNVREIAHVVAVDPVAGGVFFDVTFSASLPASSGGNSYFIGTRVATGKACGIATTTAAAAAGATSLSVNRVEAQVVPGVNPYPATANGINPAALAITGGKVPIFRIGDAVVISGGGLTETRILSFVDYRGALNFTTGLTNAYAAGATVSSASQLGDLQALVGPSFSQQTWTRVFSDALIGNPITANYNRTAGAITTTNLGAISERWAIIFTSSTAFRLVGERVGQVATGSTAGDFAPTNPATSAAYFSIPAAGWGTGWAAGNVLRFNATGAYVPLWAARTVSPSAAGGLDGSTLRLLGSVNA